MIITTLLTIYNQLLTIRTDNNLTINYARWRPFISYTFNPFPQQVCCKFSVAPTLPQFLISDWRRNCAQPDSHGKILCLKRTCRYSDLHWAGMTFSTDFPHKVTDYLIKSIFVCPALCNNRTEAGSFAYDVTPNRRGIFNVQRRWGPSTICSGNANVMFWLIWSKPPSLMKQMKFFPNVTAVLRVSSFFPVTSRECERNLSLCLLNAYVRSTMRQDRLNSLIRSRF